MPSDWANLPKNLLDSIVERFSSSSDYLRFSLVCTSWLSVAKHNLGRFAKKLLSHPEPPMLLFFNNNKASWNLYNVVDDKVRHVESKMPKRRFCGSSRGWLVHVEQDFTVTLTKPVFYKSNKRGKREDLVVRLPLVDNPDAEEIGRDEYWTKTCEYYVIKAMVSADPISNADEYSVILIYKNKSHMAVIRPSRDTTWTYLTIDCIYDVLQHGEDNFCAVQPPGRLFTFDSSAKSNSDVKSVACCIEKHKYFFREYLVDNGKDLLMVERYYNYEVPDDFDTRFAWGFKVFEFDFGKCKWIEKKTLGENVALFIGENLSISVAASNFPGCKQNCIYYNHDVDSIAMGKELLHDFGVYDMEKKSISKPYSGHLLSLLVLANQHPIWFTPSIRL